MQLEGSCAALDERRFVQPPYNDTGGCRCDSVSGPFIALVASLAVALRRRAPRR